MYVSNETLCAHARDVRVIFTQSFDFSKIVFWSIGSHVPKHMHPVFKTSFKQTLKFFRKMDKKVCERCYVCSNFFKGKTDIFMYFVKYKYFLTTILLNCLWISPAHAHKFTREKSMVIELTRRQDPAPVPAKANLLAIPATSCSRYQTMLSFTVCAGMVWWHRNHFIRATNGPPMSSLRL